MIKKRSLKQEEYEQIKSLLDNPGKIIITSHRSPDGDAMGSSLGMYHYLKEKGHDVQVVVPNNYPDFLKWLPGNDKVIQFEKSEAEAEKLIAEADIIFCLDYNDLGRMDGMGEVVGEAGAVKIVIDHHQQPGDFQDFLLSDITASSTAQIVYEFIVQLGDKDRIDLPIAECLYVGIITDTGNFRFSSTSARTHEIAAALLDMGVQPHVVYDRVFDNMALNRLKLLGYCLNEKLEVLPEYRSSIISLSSDELKRFDYKKGDSEGVVNYGLSVQNIIFSALVTEQHGEVKISFRSKGSFDVNKFARENFQGGGHVNAAGAKSDLPLDKTIEKIKELLPQYQDLLLSS